MSAVNPKRGDIWKVRSDKTVGQEIRKGRRVLFMNVPRAGRKEMRIVVPITTGEEKYNTVFWMTRIRADSTNRLDHDSFADASQMQAVSLKRFTEQMGVIESQKQLDLVSAAIALCIGYSKRRSAKENASEIDSQNWNSNSLMRALMICPNIPY